VDEDLATEARELLHQGIQAAAEKDPDLVGAVLIRWALVADWMHPDGERRVSQMYGPEDGCMPWERDGLLYHGLYGDFSADEE
jgi:hypothetical protein